MIKLVIFDIDGVITDGSIIVDETGKEQKKINLKDIDSIYEIKRRNYQIAAITGESSPIVNYFNNRFPWDCFLKGRKDKVSAILEIKETLSIEQNEICYVGDGKYDVEPLKYVKLGVCPADAIDIAKLSSDIILSKNSGEGCLWELISVLENYNNDKFGSFFLNKIDCHTQIFKSIASDNKIIKDIENVSNKIVEIFNNAGQLFLCGNGGSASDAQHIATEFISKFYNERKALNAEALSVNTSTITAVANDYNFDQIFVRQLQAKARKNDMLIGITTSGKSKNVIEAFKYAKNENITTVLFTGNSECNILCSYSDYIIRIPSSDTPRIQEAHIFLGHLIAEYVEKKLSEWSN